MGESTRRQTRDLAREPLSRTTAIRCTQSRPLGSQGTPHTPVGTAVKRIHRPCCMLPCTSPTIPPDQTITFGPSYPFATKPRGLSNVLNASRPLSSTLSHSVLKWSGAEGTRRPTASKSDRNVTGLSRAQVGTRPWLLHIQYGGPVPKNFDIISAGIFRMEERKGLG